MRSETNLSLPERKELSQEADVDFVPHLAESAPVIHLIMKGLGRGGAVGAGHGRAGQGGAEEGFTNISRYFQDKEQKQRRCGVQAGGETRLSFLTVWETVFRVHGLFSHLRVLILFLSGLPQVHRAAL